MPFPFLLSSEELARVFVNGVASYRPVSKFMPSEPLRIAIVSTPKSWGGGEQLAWTLGNGLTALGHSVTWITSRTSVLQSKLAKQGTECQTIRGKYPSISELTYLRNTLHGQGIQTIYGNDSRAINWVGLLGFGLGEVLKIGVKHTIFRLNLH